jgi:hypothetical protein
MEQNVIIFGDFDPFLGAGLKIDRKEFDIDLSKSKNDKSCEKHNADSLSIEELYDTVRSEIEDRKLPNVSSKYLLFADGKKIDEDEDTFFTESGKPIEHLDSDTLFSKGHKEMFKDYRAYLDITYHDKNRSTLLSAFLRFSEIGTRIFAEYSLYYLPPLDESIYNVDRMPINEKLFSLKLEFLTLGLIVADILLAPYVIFSLALFVYACSPIYKLLTYKIDQASKKRSTEKKIKKGGPINFGVRTSFRESIADYNYANFFNIQDNKIIGTSIVKSIFDSTADLLDAKGLDSSFIRKTMIPQVIQNINNFNGNNITHVQGNVRGNNVAIGEKSSINNINNDFSNDSTYINNDFSNDSTSPSRDIR